MRYYAGWCLFIYFYYEVPRFACLYIQSKFERYPHFSLGTLQLALCLKVFQFMLLRNERDKHERAVK